MGLEHSGYETQPQHVRGKSTQQPLFVHKSISSADKPKKTDRAEREVKLKQDAHLYLPDTVGPDKTCRQFVTQQGVMPPTRGRQRRPFSRTNTFELSLGGEQGQTTAHISGAL